MTDEEQSTLRETCLQYALEAYGTATYHTPTGSGIVKLAKDFYDWVATAKC